MLGSIVRFSIRFRGLVIAASLVMSAYGVVQLSEAGLDIFPEFSPKAVIIQTEAPGMTTTQVEVLVSQPIENAMTGLLDLDHVRSESIQGLSIVTVVFTDDTEIYRNRQFVSERLAAIVQQLPSSVRTPVVVPLSSSSATVRTIGLTSSSQNLLELRQFVDTTLNPRLLSVTGVADVNVFGGAPKSLQVQIRPESLVRHQLTMTDVLGVLRGVAGVDAVGFVENENQRLSLSFDRMPNSPRDFARIVVRSDKRTPVLLKDVADVVIAGEPPISAAQIGGTPAIVIMVIAQYGANTLSVSDRLSVVLDEFSSSLAAQNIVLFPSLFVPANYIEASLENIFEHIVLGGCFVLLILVLFLSDLRAALVSAVAIPLSLLGAVIVLLMSGVNLNVMVLGGLAIALGEVVDDAIIDTENIYRRLRENQQRGIVRTIGAVVYDASMEVRGSVVYASFIVVLVFVPLLTLGGVAGRLFAPLGITYILAVLSSLVVALTVTPALCVWLIGRRGARLSDPPLIRWCRPIYGAILRAIAAHPVTPSLIVILAIAAIAATLPAFGSQFLPSLREGHYIVHTTGLPGNSLAESIRAGSQVTNEILRVPGVRSVSQWAGRAERGADTYGSHYSEFEVALERLDGTSQQRVLDDIRSILQSYPGLLFEVNTFLTERVDETISGYSSAVAVNIFGDDLVELDSKAIEVMKIMQSIEGAADVQMRAVAHTPSINIALDWDALDRLGVRAQDVVTSITSAYGGTTVGRVLDRNRMLKLTVSLDEHARGDLAALGELPVRGHSGTLVMIGEVAEVTQVNGRYNVLHRDGQRLQVVTCNVTTSNVSQFMNELRARVADDIDLPRNIQLEFTGAAIEQARARQDLILYSLLAGFGVFMLIYIAVVRLRNVLLIAVNLPFAFLGGVLAIVATGETLSIGSVVGFVTLFGITVRNSIMLVSHYQHLVETEGHSWNLDLAVRGAQERFPSITMTALVTALAMLPIAINSDNPGREIMGPMATIVIGGLLSSALLNLLVMPAMMFHFGRFDEPAAIET